jgi:hypothetical protein
MNDDFTPSYQHTQSAPLCLVLYTLGIALLAMSWLLQDEPIVPLALTLAGGVVLLMAVSFHHLTVVDAGDHLAVWFGPLPLFQQQIPYADIRAVAVDRTLFTDGWGIHYSLRGGWVWNIWGRSCVALKLRDRVMWIGTDDAETLSQFLHTRIVHHPVA